MIEIYSLQYLLHIGILIGIYFILGISLQLSIGFTGIINLSHIAFYGIGAYTSTLLVINGTPFILALLLAGIVPFIIGVIINITIRKLKGDYVAIATLGFSFIIYAILLNWFTLTRGPMGIPGIPKPKIFGMVLHANIYYFILVIIISIISYYIIKRITDSPMGKVLGSIRDDELATRTLGKNTFKIKSIILGISAFFAGIAGSLYAHYISFIDPSAFTLLQLGTLLSIVMIGGLASFKGTFIASIIIIILPEPLRFLHLPASVIGPLRQIIYALLLLIIIIYRPKGLFGKIKMD